jgi:hypothetical protein
MPRGQLCPCSCVSSFRPAVAQMVKQGRLRTEGLRRLRFADITVPARMPAMIRSPAGSPSRVRQAGRHTLELEHDFVDVAPEPVLTRFEGADNRVLREEEILGGVASRRGVAASDVPARHAQAQVYPVGRTEPQAVLASTRRACPAVCGQGQAREGRRRPGPAGRPEVRGSGHPDADRARPRPGARTPNRRRPPCDGKPDGEPERRRSGQIEQGHPAGEDQAESQAAEAGHLANSALPRSASVRTGGRPAAALCWARLSRTAQPTSVVAISAPRMSAPFLRLD